MAYSKVSISTSLRFYFLLASLIPLALLFFIATQLFERSLEARFKHEAESTVNHVAEELDESRNNAFSHVAMISELPVIRQELRAGNHGVLEELLSPLRSRLKLDVILVLDREGQVIASEQDQARGYVEKVTEVDRAHVLASRSTWYIDYDNNGQPELRAIVPVIENNDILGYMIAGYFLDEVYYSQFAQTQGIKIDAFSSEGEAITSPQGDAAGKTPKEKLSSEVLSALKIGEGIAVSNPVLEESKEYQKNYFLFKGSDEPPVIIRVTVSKETTVNLTNSLLMILGILTVLILVLSIIAEGFASRRISRPLQELALHANKVGGGSLDHFKTGASSSEIHLLATSLNKMVDSLGESREELLRRADIDGMTGLFSHRHIQARLDQELKRSLRNGKPFAVVMADIDNFKLFNDTHGHPIGDRVLHLVTRVLLGTCRETDIIGRYGGDEFIILLPDTDREGSRQVAERILFDLAMANFSVADGRSLPIGLSIGIAVFPYDGSNRQDLINLADAALYEVKRQGGNGISLAGKDAPLEETDLGMFGVLESLVTAVDNKDRYTKAHSEDVTKYSLMLSDELGLSSDMKMAIHLAGLLHDVGKIGIPDRILRKPGPLTDVEREVIKQHVLVGDMIIKDVPHLSEISKAVLHHHERYDGAGYPHGLKGEDIPLIARVMSVADGFSAMTTDRPYRKALSLDEAFRELNKNAGTQFDPSLVKAFITTLDKEKANLFSQRFS